MRKINFAGMCLFIAAIQLLCQQQNMQDKTINTYVATKIKEKINIDGRLSENAWKFATPVTFNEMKNGSEPEYRTIARILWDDEFLYIGMEIEDADIWARASLKDSECPEDYAKRVNIHRYMKDPEWHRLECDIMTFDNFVKVFLDPDADNENYIEFHLNVVNNLFDAWYKEGLKPGEIYLESPHVTWTCPKLTSATFIRGTLNAPHDVDEGWSFEMAIPWSGLKPLVKGNCPPEEQDVWGILLGRVHRDYSWSPDRFYWTWPVVGDYVCHNPSLYGKLVFLEKPVRWKTEEKKVEKNPLKKHAILFASGGGIPEEVIPGAKQIGAKGFLCSAYPVSQLKKYIDAGKKYGVEIFANISLADVNVWRERNPGTDIPLQRMSEEETRTLEYLIKDSNNIFSTNYQWGEEPKGKKVEVLTQNLLCFHDERVIKFFKDRIKEVLDVEGLTGISFDFFGYQNYQCCRCDISEKLFQQHRKNYSDIDDKKAREKFSLDTLVSFYNELGDYARSIKPDVKIITHIYPVFLPDPFYGNRLDIDYCAQTVAWFLPWNLARVARYTRTIKENEKQFFQRSNAVAMIGYYYQREMFPTKTPQQIEKELRTIFENGCNIVLVHCINDVLKSPDVKKIFSQYFKGK